MSSERCEPSTSASSRKRKERETFDVLKPVAASNQLLAGYLAHEFLTKGTLLGEPWRPVRAQAEPLIKETKPMRIEIYADMARLLMADEAHIPGLVNPTQLSRWVECGNSSVQRCDS